MAVGGLVRLRKHQFGRQADFTTVVAATRAYGCRGVPGVDRGWTDPEVDAGSLDTTAAPYLGAASLTAPYQFNALEYNDLPLIFSGFFGGAVEPTGSGPDYTWLYEPASVAPLDDLDAFTEEFGDNILTDWYQFGGGFIESFEITGPEGLGALTATTNWRYASVASTGATDIPVTGVVPTPGLSVDTNGAKVYLKDIEIQIGADQYSTTKVADALHTFTFRGSGDIDEKRYANGDQSFDVDAFVRTSRLIELEATWAKTADIVGVGSESDAWMSDTAVTRYIRILATSTVEADTGTFYSWDLLMPMRYYTREEGEVGGNSVVVLTAHAFYDPDDLGLVTRSTIVNTLSGPELGTPGS